MEYLRDVWLCETDPVRKLLKQRATGIRYLFANRKRRSTDVFVISFPKSGRTWHRMLLGNYVYQLNGDERSAVDVESLTRGVAGARVTYTHNCVSIADGIDPGHPRVANPSLWRGRKVIFLVREPKDVMVSAWFHARYRSRRYSGTLKEFIRSPLTGIEKLVTARNRWWDHHSGAAAWTAFSYEQMHKDTATVLRATLEFIGHWPVEEGEITEAVGNSTFSSMRRLELEGSAGHASMKRRDGGQDALKVRVGRVGGFREHLGDDDIRFVDDWAARIRDPFASLYGEPALGDERDALRR